MGLFMDWKLETEVMLEIPKAPFVVLCSSCNSLMTLGMMSRVFPKVKKFAVVAEFPSGSKFLFPKGKYIFANLLVSLMKWNS